MDQTESTPTPPSTASTSTPIYDADEEILDADDHIVTVNVPTFPQDNFSQDEPPVSNEMIDNKPSNEAANDQPSSNKEPSNSLNESNHAISTIESIRQSILRRPSSRSSLSSGPRPSIPAEDDNNNDNKRDASHDNKRDASQDRRSSTSRTRRSSTSPTTPHLRQSVSRSLRGSMRRSVTQSITWAQLARRRSTEFDGRRGSGLSSDAGVAITNGGEACVGTKEHPSACDRLCHVMKSKWAFLNRCMKKAYRHPKSILLPTFMTFVVLTAAGLFAIFYSRNQYYEDYSELLVDQSRELAYELDDLLSKSLLPLFTLKEMAGQFDQFQTLRGEIVQHETYYNEEGRAFRNVTQECTERSVLELYWKAAESIVQDSRMGDALLNIQLQPAGTVCLNYPPVTLNPLLDHTKAIGLDRIHDIYQSPSARESITLNHIGSTGPIVLVQDIAALEGEKPNEALIFWTPIFDEGVDLVISEDGEEIVEFENFWGFAGVLLDWDAILRQIDMYIFFDERDMQFALIQVMDDGSEKVVEATVDEEPLTRETAHQALPLYARDDWVLLVDVPPPTVGNPAFVIWGSIVVIIASFFLSLALMLILVSRNDHEELLSRCIPRNFVRRLHAGETVIEKYEMATICFIDIVSFTTMSGRMKAHEVMEMLQVLFKEFDQLTEKHNCFNCETIGDAYITVSGGPEGNDATAGAANIAAFALDAVDAVKKLEFGSGQKKIKIRVGVASGPVVAGVIGTINVPKFTLFGETTSQAEEMEKTSLPLQVQCSEETMKLLRSNFRTNNSFQCKRRKEEGEDIQNTWWIVRPSEFDSSFVSVMDDMTTALSASNGVAPTEASTLISNQSMQRRSIGMASSGTDETKTSLLDKAPHELDRESLRRNSSVVCDLEDGALTDKNRPTFESYLMSDKNMGQKRVDGKRESCLQQAMTSIIISLRSFVSMFRIAILNKRILLGTFITFAVLCAAGLAILFVYANDYEEDKRQYATSVGNKADRWLEKELDKALLPLFAMSELVKVTDKWDDLPPNIEVTEQYNMGGSVYNNVTGICDDPVYVDPFVEMASSIKNSSGLQGILVNVQLAPIGVLCLTYPKNNTEDFPPGVYLDTSGAIGLNLFDTPSRAASSKAAVTKQEKTIQGPITLVQGDMSVVDEALIARYPVFIDGYDMDIDGVSYPLWGLTIVLMDWDKLKTKFGIYNFFSRESMQFRMTRYDSWNDRIVVIANSSNHEILDSHNSITMDLEVSDDTWTLMVGFDDGFIPAWLDWSIACVIVGSFLVSLMVMMMLASTAMNEMLLHRMMPQKAINSIQQGKTFVERDSEATIFFSHLIGYENISGEMSSKEFLLMLTQLYTEFDKLALKYECTKIETIGAYYIVKGPGPDLCSLGERDGVARIALFALHATDLVRNYQYKGVKFQIRAGFASGPIVAGVIGSGGLPKYTVFGDTVNFSSRMESTSKPMMIQCPHLSYSLLRKSSEFVFDLEEREEDGELGVFVKGKGQTMTYWLKGYTIRKLGIRTSSLLLQGGSADGHSEEEDDDGDIVFDTELMVTASKRVSFKDCGDM